MPVATAFVSPPLGYSIPYLTPHAVSVSLPKWEDNVDYEEGRKRVVDAMQTGYPRFFVHRSIQALAAIADKTLARNPGHEQCYLYPTEKIAQGCIAFLQSRQPSVTSGYYLPWTIQDPSTPKSITVFPVFMASEDYKIGKQYWQHTGDGVSSRIADYCLKCLGHRIPGAPSPTAPLPSSSSTATPSVADGSTAGSVARGGGHPPSRGFSRNKHYAKKASAALEAIFGSSPPATSSTTTNSASDNRNGSSLDDDDDDEASHGPVQGEDLSTYIEERYARNLTEAQAPQAKVALRRRIAGVLKENCNDRKVTPTTPNPSLDDCQELDEHPELQESSRGVSKLTEEDVYLYPSGMSAIFHAFQTVLKSAALENRPIGKSVCFGFPYTDTLKILEKWGPGCHFFGKGLDEDLPALEELLRSSIARYEANPESTNPDDKPILSLFCEFPTNPLLRSPNLDALRQLANKYNFDIVIDETVGGFTNVECLPFADICVSSLTKVFSGDSNVMGGSLTLNPTAPHYDAHKRALAETYEDAYYSTDALFMERNSRDFKKRVDKINKNAECLCDFLNAHTEKPVSNADPSSTKPVIKKVFYPKYITPGNYEARMRRLAPSASSNGSRNGTVSATDQAYEPGYGGLFSLTFTSLNASRAFFDTLKCCKGPSLGTNFTLASPYTLLAHYLELEWASHWDVEEGLVRVSVGLEEPETLIQWFSEAVQAAEEAEAKARA